MNTAPGWRIGDLVEEATRRLGGLHVLSGVALGFVLAAAFAATTIDLRVAFEAERAAQLAGLDVSTVTVAQDSTLDAADCERLGRAPGVQAAGGSLGENTTLGARWTPSGLAVPVIDVTPGALRTWWPGHASAVGVFVGQDLSTVRGLTPGMRLDIDGESVAIAGTLPESVAPDALQSAVVRVVPARGRAQECWIRTEATAGAAAEPLAQVTLADTTLLVAPYLDPTTRDQIVTNLTSSPTAAAWLPATVAGLVLIGFVGIARRREVAIYRTTGSRWSALTAMHVVQVVLLAWPALLLVTTTGVLFVVLAEPILPVSADVLWYLVQPVLHTTSAWVVLGPLVLRIAASGAIVDNLGD